MSQTEVQLVKGLNLDPAAPADATKVDSSGRFLVGSSSYSGNATILAQGHSGASTGPAHVLLKLGNNAPASGGDLGYLFFSDSNSSGGFASWILGQRDGGTWTSGSSMPGRLLFSTTADGASSPTERLRISQSGAFGLSGANYGTSGQVLTSQGSGSAPQWAAGPVAGSSAFFVYDNSGYSQNPTTYSRYGGVGSATVITNVGSNYDGTNSAGRYTAPADGVYVFGAITSTNSVTSGLTVYLRFQKNGSTVREFYNGDATRSYNNNGDADMKMNVQTSGEVVLSLSANDYIEIEGRVEGSLNNTNQTKGCDRRGHIFGYRLS